MKALVTILSSFLLMITSCNRQPDLERVLQSFASEAEADISDYGAILFIPLEGCGSCIQRGTEFYQNNGDNTNILFVFCTYKPYAYDFLKNNNRSNVIIDNKNVAIRDKILSTAPVAYIKESSHFKYLGVTTGDFDYTTLLRQSFEESEIKNQ